MIIKNLTVTHKKGSGYTSINIFNSNGSIFKSIGFRQSQADFDKSKWVFDDNFIRTLNENEYNDFLKRTVIPKAKKVIQDKFNIEISEFKGECDYDSRIDYRNRRYISNWEEIIHTDENKNDIFLAEKFTTKFYLKKDITESDIKDIFSYFL